MSETEDVAVLLLDDHQIFLDGMQMLLATRPHLRVVGACLSVPEARKVLEVASVDVLITDLKMPDVKGVSFIRSLSEAYSDLRIIALTMIEDSAVVTETMQAGANGYLLKNTGIDELEQAITHVMNGQRFVSQAIHALLLQRLSKPDVATDVLSARETEVLHYLSKGFSSKLIADELNLSIDTVKFHRKNLLAKLNQPNVAALVSYAHSQGLISGD